MSVMNGSYYQLLLVYSVRDCQYEETDLAKLSSLLYFHIISVILWVNTFPENLKMFDG